MKFRMLTDWQSRRQATGASGDVVAVWTGGREMQALVMRH